MNQSANKHTRECAFLRKLLCITPRNNQLGWSKMSEHRGLWEGLERNSGWSTSNPMENLTKRHCIELLECRERLARDLEKAKQIRKNEADTKSYVRKKMQS